MTDSNLVFLIVSLFYFSVAAVLAFAAVVIYTKIETGKSFIQILKEF